MKMVPFIRELTYIEILARRAWGDVTAIYKAHEGVDEVTII